MPEEPLIRSAQYASKKGEIALRDHEYDGIREYDQLLPNWWLVIFFAGLIFSLGYWLAYYQFGLAKTDHQKIKEAMALIADKKAKALEKTLASLDDQSLVVQWAADPERVASGKQIFLTNCIACHGQDLHARIDIGGGNFVALPGLSLKDGEWKYGSKPLDIFKIIHDGTPAESAGHNGAKMEPWGQKIPPFQIAELTAFIISENLPEFTK
jgi:cytochrome c oxidase cbb3-type subunit 3